MKIENTVSICSKLINYLIPNYCILCLTSTRSNLSVCQECIEQLPHHQNGCFQCADEIFAENNSQICGNCQKNPPPFKKTIAAFNYLPPISQWITQLKFHHQIVYGDLLGKLFIQKINLSCNSKNKPQFLIPVPLHSKRLRHRGHNQSLEITRSISRHLQIPIEKKLCSRVKNTTAQSSLPLISRQSNLKDCFQSFRKIEGAHVAIIDDVMTSGATVFELSKTLQAAGASEIEIWCIARTTS